MSLHSISREISSLFSEQEKIALAYINTLGYEFQFRLGEKKIYYRTTRDTYWTELDRSNIEYFSTERHNKYKFDMSLVEVVP